MNILKSFFLRRVRVLPVLAVSLLGNSIPRAHASDAAWFQLQPDLETPKYDGVQFSGSHYLTMRDGVKIAYDLYLPKGIQAGDRVPALLWQTRYLRSVQPRWLTRLIFGNQPYDHTGLYGKIRNWFVPRGYAWMDTDVRGTGASTGHGICPYSPDEIKDGAEVVDWIVAQPWSNGRVGSLGVSYPGSASEMLLINRHPAVKAIAPLYAMFDAYTDIAFPGGIHAVRFTEDWHHVNISLDQNTPEAIAGAWVKLFITGVSPAMEDPDKSMLRQALRDHEQNYNIHRQALGITFRDDVSPDDPRPGGTGTEILAGHPLDPSGSIGLFSPHNYRQDIESSGAAIYGYTGWFDGAYTHSAIKRFLNVHTPGSRMIIGPWGHGGGWQFNPYTGSRKTSFSHNAELLRFFDRYLKDTPTGIDDEPPVHYFTLVEEKWKATDRWPPPSTPHVLYFRENHALVEEPPAEADAHDEYRVDPTHGTGPASRFRVQTLPDAPVAYPDRKEQDRKLLVYQSAPLGEDVEVTGHPIVTLYVDSTKPDGSFFVYLEDVDPEGNVAYVTEGELRAIHRKLSSGKPPYATVVPYRTFKRADAMPLAPGEVAELKFDILPTSYIFQKGHSIRLALAGADLSHFGPLPGSPPTLRVHRSTRFPSYIELPVKKIDPLD
ncbi:MAG: CocE/NonD family hydrolase [Nitrospirae bacterium]|nr:CocE/NonD family hydrolase [Nitrospirota bacterium]